MYFKLRMSTPSGYSTGDGKGMMNLTDDMPEGPVPFFDGSNPRSLPKLFLLLSVLSVAIILLLAGYGIHKIYGSQMIREAEEDAVAVGQAILQQERGILIARDAGGQERIAVAREKFAGLDARMRDFLRPFRIYKIKVFSGDKTIVYSTDPSIIGIVDGGNAKLARVLESGEVVSNLESKDKVLDLADEQRFNVDVVETYLPIRAGDAILGSFEVYVDVTRTRERIIRVVASSVFVLFTVLVVVFTSLYVPMRKGAMQLKRAQDELRKIASIDTLTGLFNRGHMNTRIHEEYSRIGREGNKGVNKSTIGFIMADLDHFKRINDEYGHPAGDEVLRAVSENLRSATRIYDILSRYGGEEFLIALPNSDLEDAKLVAERIRSGIERTPIVVGGRTVKVTVSLGASCSANDEDDEMVVIERADKALYKAKSEGRNRVAWL